MKKNIIKGKNITGLNNKSFKYWFDDRGLTVIYKPRHIVYFSANNEIPKEFSINCYKLNDYLNKQDNQIFLRRIADLLNWFSKIGARINRHPYNEIDWDNERYVVSSYSKYSYKISTR